MCRKRKFTARMQFLTRPRYVRSEFSHFVFHNVDRTSPVFRDDWWVAYTGVNSLCVSLRRERAEQEEKGDLRILCETQSSIVDYAQAGKGRVEDNCEINRSHRLIVRRGVRIISALASPMKDPTRLEYRITKRALLINRFYSNQL